MNASTRSRDFLLAGTTAPKARKPRRPALFTVRDLTRALKAAQRAGLPIASVRIEPSGAIVILPGSPVAVAPFPQVNPWDVS
jgi:hypothetical protein